jgi:hypothetical protein
MGHKHGRRGRPRPNRGDSSQGACAKAELGFDIGDAESRLVGF